jgi:tetratricopeptide (TPR) repeat protein
MLFSTIAPLHFIPASFRTVSPRQRVVAVVVLAAAAAVAVVTGVTLATRQTPPQPKALGKPPLTRFVPAPAAVRAAYARWPDGTVEEMSKLAAEQPRSAPIQFYAGLALISAGFGADAVTPLRQAKRLGRDSWTEVLADSLLHPQFFRDYPPFVPAPGNALLRRGAQFQAQGRQHSAERVYERAARQDPDDDEAQVAAAVGRFDKGNLSAAFSRLGPLTRRFPRSQSVRFHLGLLLAWTGQRDPAVAQFRRTVALGPKTALGREGKAFLDRLETGGTQTREK